MKKGLFLSFMFIAFAMSWLLSSCFKEETVVVSKSKEEQFKENLEDLRHKQESVITATRTRSFSGLCDEDLNRVAAELDSLIEAFMWENAEYLVESMPEWNLSEDEIEMLSLDEDALFAFLNEYFTPGFGEQVYSFLHAEDFPRTRSSASSSQTTTAFTPFESLVLTNIEVVSEFDDSELMLFEDTKIMCQQQYKLELSACKDEFVANTINYAGALAGVMAAAGGTLGGIIGSVAPVVGTAGGTIQGATAGVSLGMYLGHFAATKMYYACRKRADGNFIECNKRN